MLSVAEASAQALAGARCLARPETVRLAEAYGRVLAATVASPCPMPRDPLATMDGFALRSADADAPAAIVGSSLAGAPFAGQVEAGQAIRIATGAVVPPGLDCVIPIEDAQVAGSSVSFNGGAQGNIRAAGEDLAAGAAAVAAGTLLAAPQLALLRSIGIDRVSVHARPVVGLLSTGDELREPGEQLPSGAIYDANRQMLAALLADMGFMSVDLGIARDELPELTSCLDRAAAECDVIVTSGGASVGTRDLIREALAERGRLDLWKVAIKPGKPFIVGSCRGKPLFGLPGNPASSYVCMMMLAAPALWKIAGRDPLPDWPRRRATVSEPLAKTPGRADYQRGIASDEPDGSLSVRSAGPQGSGSISVLAAANCLIELAAEVGDVAAGSEVAVIPIAGCRP